MEFSMIQIRFCLLLALLTLSSASAEMKTDVVYRRVGEVPLALDAFVPDGSGPFPAVIYVHGGGFVGGDKKPYPVWLDLAAAEGFAWCSVNYRLAPKVLATDQVDDVDAAIVFLQKNAAAFKIDPKRLFLMGASSGGYVVSGVGVRHHPADGLAGVISFFGEYDIETRTKPTAECVRDGKLIHFDPPQDCLAERWKTFFGAPDAASERARKIFRDVSPIAHVHPAMPPFLLLHGTKDLNIPYGEAVRMCDSIRRQGAQCELVTVPGAAHGGWDTTPAFQIYREPLRAWLRRRAAGN